MLALQFLLCLSAFCLCPRVARDMLSCSFSPALVTGCVCLHVSVCTCVRVPFERAGVFVCEMLCVPVRLRESGCEKTSACLSESVPWEFYCSMNRT